MDPQILKDTAGNPAFVVIPIDDWEAMDDAADARDILNRLASGDEERIPFDAVMRMESGESPVKVFRELRGMSQKQLADKADVSQAYISGIERGDREGKVSVLKAIAEALGVMLDDLV